MAGLRLIAAPSTEPLSIEDAIAHLKVENAEEQLHLRSLIVAARQDLDGREGRLMGVALITQTWELVLDCFPYCEITFPLRPLQTVDSIYYYDANGNEQLLPSADYIVDTASHIGRVVPAPNKSWPGTSYRINSVRIQFKAGYGATPGDVPAIYRHAMLVMVGHLYAHRGDDGAEIPSAYFTLLGVRGGVS